MNYLRLNSKSFLLLGILSLFLFTAACSSESNEDSDSESSSDSESENVEIDIALFYTENDAYNTAFEKFRESVEKETEGRVSFKPFYSGSLVSLFDTLDAVSNGSVESGVLSAGAISGEMPAMGLLEVLGTFENEEHFKKVYEDATPLIEDMLDDKGVELLYWGLGSTDNLIVHEDEFLTDLDQFKGLKMRSQGRWMGKQLEAIGASPVNMDPSELYLALQNGTVDSTFQGASLVASQKLYEVSGKAVSTGLSVNAIPHVVNQDIWNQVSSEDQETIKNISMDVGTQSYGMLQEREQEDIDKIEEEGTEIHVLEDDKKSAMLEVMNKVRDEIGESSGKEGEELLEIIQKYEQE